MTTGFTDFDYYEVYYNNPLDGKRITKKLSFEHFGIFEGIFDNSKFNDFIKIPTTNLKIKKQSINGWQGFSKNKEQKDLPPKFVGRFGFEKVDGVTVYGYGKYKLQAEYISGKRVENEELLEFKES